MHKGIVNIKGFVRLERNFGPLNGKIYPYVYENDNEVFILNLAGNVVPVNVENISFLREQENI